MRLDYYRKLLTVVAIAIFCTNVPVYLYNNYGMTWAEAPKHWVIIYCVLALPVLIRQMTTTDDILRSPIMLWCFGFVWVSLVWFLPSSQSNAAWQEVRWRLLSIMILVTFTIMFRHPGAVRLARQTLVWTVLLGVTLNVYELFIPMSFSNVMGRSAGLYENANMSGEALVMGMILSVGVLAPRYRVPFLLLTGIGVFLTLSRAGIVAWFISVAWIVSRGAVHPKHLLLTGFLSFIVASFLVLPRWDHLLSTWERAGSINQNMEERLAWFSDPFGVSDYSSWERKLIARQAWEKIMDNPTFGRGTGSSQETLMGLHNQYLVLMTDHGLAGALILPLFMAAMIWGARGESRDTGIILAVVILWLSFFTHGALTREYILVPCALMAGMATTSRASTLNERGRFLKAMAADRARLSPGL